MKKSKRQKRTVEHLRKNALQTESADGGTPKKAEELSERKGEEIYKRLSAIFDALGLKKKREPSVIYLSLLRGLCFSLLSLLIGRAPLLLDTYPMAIALLCAAEKNVFYIFLGAVISAFTAKINPGVLFSPYVYLSSYIMIIFIRIAARIFIDPPQGFSVRRLLGLNKQASERINALKIISSEMFSENTYLKMASSCVAAFLVSLYSISVGQYRFYDLFSAMFSMVSAPAITFIYSGVWNDSSNRQQKIYKNVSAATILISIVFSLRETFFLGISAAVFTAFFAVTYLSRHRGILSASAIGLFAGLAVSPIYSPAFVLAAIASGIIKKSALGGCFAALGISMLWGLYIDGIGAISTLLPAMLVASVFVSAADSLPYLQKTVEASEKSDSEATKESEDELAEAKLGQLAVAFGELSGALYDISDRLKAPGMTEIRSFCLESFEEFCIACPKNKQCKEKNYNEYSEMITEIGQAVLRDGRVRAQLLPDHIKERCGKLDDVLIEINSSYAKLIERRVAGEKTQLFALDYEAFSHIISDAIELAKNERATDSELLSKLKRLGGKFDIGLKELRVTGSRKKRIYSGDIGRKAEKMGANELRSLLEEACGFPLKDPIFELRNGKIALSTESARRFSLTAGKSATPGKDESVCGDTAAFFENQNDNFYALISDGMGSGESAALTSGICGLFLTKMLSAGNRKETALKMLNTLLLSKGEECSATVDLMEIDLISGTATFLKSGAAPSFVRRRDKLYKLRSNTAPIGIMSMIDAEQVRFDLEDGDIIIMLSDGIGQAPEESVWLMEMLLSDWGDSSLSTISDKICAKAKEEGSNDDSTVLLLQVKELQKMKDTA